jgi:hypothetical protein
MKNENAEMPKPENVEPLPPLDGEDFPLPQPQYCPMEQCESCQ